MCGLFRRGLHHLLRVPPPPNLQRLIAVFPKTKRQGKQILLLVRGVMEREKREDLKTAATTCVAFLEKKVKTLKVRHCASFPPAHCSC